MQYTQHENPNAAVLKMKISLTKYVFRMFDFMSNTSQPQLIIIYLTVLRNCICNNRYKQNHARTTQTILFVPINQTT